MGNAAGRQVLSRTLPPRLTDDARFWVKELEMTREHVQVGREGGIGWSVEELTFLAADCRSRRICVLTRSCGHLSCL